MRNFSSVKTEKGFEGCSYVWKPYDSYSRTDRISIKCFLTHYSWVIVPLITQSHGLVLHNIHCSSSNTRVFGNLLKTGNYRQIARASEGTGLQWRVRTKRWSICSAVNCNRTQNMGAHLSFKKWSLYFYCCLSLSSLLLMLFSNYNLVGDLFSVLWQSAGTKEAKV